MIRKGRFNKPAAEIAQRYSESVSFDWRLYRHDIAGSHEIVGKIVAHSAENQIPLNQVPLAELKNFSSLFDSETARIFDASSALSKRRAIGAPAPDNIASQIALWHSRLRSHK